MRKCEWVTCETSSEKQRDWSAEDPRSEIDAFRRSRLASTQTIALVARNLSNYRVDEANCLHGTAAIANCNTTAVTQLINGNVFYLWLELGKSQFFGEISVQRR